MKNYIDNLFSAWKEVFGKPRYFILAVFVALTFYSINVFIASYSSLISVYTQQGFFQAVEIFSIFFVGFMDRIFFSSFITLIIIAVLFGILISLITYKTNMIKNNSGKTMGFLGTTGIFLGVLAPGCAACGIGLLSFLGISAAILNFLPYNGLELSILAILVLGYATLKISEDIRIGIICKI
ncbi:hypothetical protein J4407_03280 [Candidatus Pacearchaeota archaeon]|nr:hypothetical protein [Candidatus Pacearchaeota archaeon]